MSKKLESPNRDIQGLEAEGLLLELREAHLVVHGVPHVTPAKVVAHGRLVSVVDPRAAGGTSPSDHQVWWIGDHPSNLDGSPIQAWGRTDGQDLGPGLRANHRFSMKLRDENRRKRAYRDDLEKLMAYYKVISGPAFELDPVAASEPPAPDQAPLPPSPFVYPDTASARAGIVMIARKLAEQRIGIVGLGGTGSYVLDQVAKTRVAEIHIYDADEFKSHNAYRAPGAASEAEANAETKKVAYFAALYGRMHKGIRPHDYALTADNAGELEGMDFVFLCMDTGPDKEALVERLEAASVPFVDTGLGLSIAGGAITGLVRATTSSWQVNDVRSRKRLSFREPDNDDPYRQNIQVSELNALNAIMAVIRWKKLFGFYADDKREHHSIYTVPAHSFTLADRFASEDQDDEDEPTDE
jgi:hypothetical protein